MANLEVIALLCAGSTRYHESARGWSGDALSRSELAGLLSGLDKPTMALALAKYAGDLESERVLVQHVRVWLAGVAVRESWQIIRGRPILCNLAALAVFEVVRPNRCIKCFGRGVVLVKVCPCCNGTKHKALSGRKIANGIGIDEAHYRRQWKPRYDACFNYVQGIDLNVKSVLYYADKEKKLAAC